ncbi:MoaA/NifB/PqqE/SkfB family radical SAM enzyme [Paenibacillus forsythiae]|uniref:MoaA/NifB/PqqE/SkfB family radical SAM enzyme n=1 Tax=Paenibacillus forsythiae TaxID=365616 RepID=A0ABU3H949_9BACL|nr:radical SAM protein [Paenibacillus forsythiae]MDT3426542.1 MoaA/NifB/PqqE/SkfB family radical SAM enzyme [Paenibacillus forsythiae]
MITLKNEYRNKGIDYFTDEYYEFISKLQGYKGSGRKKESYYVLSENFREKGKALYECLALELVHQLHCQLKCEYCYVALDSKSQSNKPVPANDIIRLVDQAAEVDPATGKTLFGQIAFIGGEPTLHPHLPDIMQYTLDNGLMPLLITNGVKLADIDFARKVCLPGSVIVTHLPYLDAEGDKELDQLTKFPGYSEILKQAIRNIVEIKKEWNALGEDFELVGDFVINKQTEKYAFTVFKYCRNNNITPFFERMRVSDDKRNLHLVPEDRTLKELLFQIFEYDKEHFPHLVSSENANEEELLLKKIEYLITPAFANSCTMSQTGIHVKYNQNGFGEALSCVGQLISHGNTQSNTLQEIVRKKQDSRIFMEQKDFIAGPCASCELYDSVGCEGGCRGNANTAFSCGRASDPECLFIRKECRTDRTIMAPDNCNHCPAENTAACGIKAQTV